MGFSVSWLAFQGCSKEQIFTKTGITEGTDSDPHNEGPASGATFPNGWYVIFLAGVEHRLVADASLGLLSQGCRIVAATLSETVMASIASEYRDGAKIWRLAHQGDLEITDLEEEGNLPGKFAQIRKSAFDKQIAEGGQDTETDYIFDVPLDTALSVCGYRHDIAEYDWGKPAFVQLNLPVKSSFFSRIFGRSR